MGDRECEGDGLAIVLASGNGEMAGAQGVRSGADEDTAVIEGEVGGGDSGAAFEDNALIPGVEDKSGGRGGSDGEFAGVEESEDTNGDIVLC